MTTLSAASQVFATPELLEIILLHLPTGLLDLTDQADPRSRGTHFNSRIVTHLLHCTAVSRSWYTCIHGSSALKRHLFLSAALPSSQQGRSWTVSFKPCSSTRRTGIYRPPSHDAPILNPLLQMTFPSYNFRFWQCPRIADLGQRTTIERHVASMTITRSAFQSNSSSPIFSQSSMLQAMQLSQPPCFSVQIWGRTQSLSFMVPQLRESEKVLITAEGGVTLSMVHDQVRGQFEKEEDVIEVQVMTV